MKGVFGETTSYKVMHRNNIGKILYESTISVNSKMRRVAEKSHKNQLKIAVCVVDPESKKPSN